MKIVLEKGHVFYQDAFQELESLVIDKGKIVEISIVSSKAKKTKAASKKKKADSSVKPIDCTGKFITPGFIDAHTHISLQQDGFGSLDNDSNELYGLLTPQVRAFDALKMRDKAFEDAIRGGVTTVMVSPGSSNPIGGQACIVKTARRLPDDAVIKDSAAMKLAFGENPKNNYGGQKKFPCTRMGTAAVVREFLMKAQDYQKFKKTKDFKDRDIKLEAMQPLIEGKMLARAHAHSADDIITAYRIAQEFNFELVFDHCTEGHLIAKELGMWKAKAVVGPLFVARLKPEVANRSYETPLRLMEEGCLVALTTDHPVNPIESLSMAATMCVRYGMEEKDAIKAVTENAAAILGLEKSIGKLEPEFDADVVIWNGNPLDGRSKPEKVYIDGELVFED